ncbi:MAG: 1-deoxy-D-xylulose-5-phosphate synthase [Bacilli bacterium]|nr:1-deoxy-D-xylulose-5-phosphate synthase [Bacilli bacterium]
MIINRINNNRDLKKLNYKEKIELTNEIRKYLVETISKTGGHLASNLGVVELTIALESVFDLPKDKIIWDVGHQSYVHKIINGRREKVKRIRQFGHISGFPKTKESDTDCFNTGHSSTSISAALGMAIARDIKKEDYNIIAVIGDGALTGGMALEALNHVGSIKKKMIIILNDNEMSISKNISGMNELLTNLRLKKRYRKSNNKLKKIISSVPLIGQYLTYIIKKIKKTLKQLFIPGMYFEEIGLKYIGPIDGHNIEELEAIFRKAKNIDEPVLIHVITKKGKGYKFAEESPEQYHGVSPFNIDTGVVPGNNKTYSEVFGNKLCELAKENKKIVAITAAMKDGTGLSRFSEMFKERFYDVGIAEQHALTLAAGIAKNGMIPVVSIYSSFYQRGFDQVIHDICTQNLHVVMCVDRAGCVGSDGETHQGLFDLSFFKIIPNIVILAPKNFKELELMLEYAIKIKKPIVIRYPRGGEKKNYFTTTPIKFATLEKLKDGKDISIIAIGNMVSRAMDVATILEKQNIMCDVINIRFLKPIDETAILESIKKTKKIITIEDNTIIGGLSSSIKELIVNNNLNNIKIKSYAYPDKFIEHGTVDELEKKYKLDIQSIINDINKEVNHE